MIKPALYLFLLGSLLLGTSLYPQEPTISENSGEVSSLFSTQEVLPIKLNYSNRDMKRKTNDSTYINSTIAYRQEDGAFKTLEVKLRARGKYRRKNCYFTPIKMKIKKSIAKGSLFDGHKEFKLVLPCLLQKDNNDNVVKEYMAYKMYELISPYHYKTRLLSVDFDELKGSKIVNHKIKAFMIEDIKKVANRHQAKRVKRSIHPLEQDNICSVQNDFFQYMIGNTDYSVAYQHNEKLIFTSEKKMMPIPFDFDMSGLVDASYAVVSQVQNEKLPISSVTQRMFRGFKRSDAVFHQVRRQFLDNEQPIMAVVNSLEGSFDNPKEFVRARDFINSFFVELTNDKRYASNILGKARIK